MHAGSEKHRSAEPSAQCPKVEEDQLQLLSFTTCHHYLRVAYIWVVCVRTHMRVVKMAAIARTARREKRSSSATKQFQRKYHIISDLRPPLGM